MKVRFHVTGFGPFFGVEKNPTELKDIIEIQSVSVLQKVAAVDTLLTLHELQLEQTRVTESSEGQSETDQTVWLHMGVGTQTPEYNLEKFGWNEATFRAPDQRGWSPNKQALLPKIYPSINQNLTTSLSPKLDDMIAQLKQEGHAVEISEDPGRFLCNFVFFHSLHYCQQRQNNHALFLHVPSFQLIKKEEQLAFVRFLIDTIAKNLTR
ncbi:hypothetical protein PROFUN_11578 [Planoprotostelium fungivorum]|uniref:Pyrrolidone-carboxylate peptidase n=1 Tax=Planoprotostelium fungivorum TaxID=1890364 RepID=A0A2P6N9T2_9EUKA|nr:hypothetical protein PROFUN_11578 [Planoprotostelium fungivorum]